MGYFNQKFFLLFILYASVATGWTTVSVGHLLALSSAGLLGKANALSAAQVFFLSEGLCISGLVSLILTPFTGFHLWLVANNKTTLEYCERSNPSISYDFGIFHNFCQVFGYNPLFWLFPIQTAPGEGIGFDRRKVITADDGVDEEEDKIRAQMEANLGISSQRGRDETCCVRNWDKSDSPLVLGNSGGGGWWNSFICKCFEFNDFRDKCQSGFTNILAGPSEEP